MSSQPNVDHAASAKSNAAAQASISLHPNKARRVGARLLRLARRAVPPILFFFIGFNLIVVTTNLLVAQYLVAVSSFMLATIAALVVGKAVLFANALSVIHRYDRAPLIQPILFKTGVYWASVVFVRLQERFFRFSVVEHNSPGDFLSYLIISFSWRRFTAISIWVFVLFLIYVTASEFSRLFGPGEMRRLLFTYRPSELRLDRRERFRELLSLSRLADEHAFDEFQDPTSVVHRQMMDIMRRLAVA
jgi:hypothetical protein